MVARRKPLTTFRSQVVSRIGANAYHGLPPSAISLMQARAFGWHVTQRTAWLKISIRSTSHLGQDICLCSCREDLSIQEFIPTLSWAGFNVYSPVSIRHAQLSICSPKLRAGKSRDHSSHLWSKIRIPWTHLHSISNPAFNPSLRTFPYVST